MGRCPSIEPSAFVHRFIGTLQSPWPKGSAVRSDTRTPRTQCRQQHAREERSARRPLRTPSLPQLKAPRTYRLRAPSQRRPREPPRTADAPRDARNHPHTRTAARAKPGYTAQVPSAKPPHPSFFGIDKRMTSSR